MGWVKLHRFNDWGADYFAMPGKGLSEHGTSCKRKYSIPFVNGDRLHVRWPDGTITIEKVKHRSKRTRVGDMGREYDVDTDIPGIEFQNRGVTTWYPLDAVEVEENDLPIVGASQNRSEE